MALSPSRVALSAVALCLLTAPASAQQAALRVTAIPWVQENPDIPHPALNGLPTQLQAIAEGGNCGGAYTYRWDWNGDGDYDDASEGWNNASAGGIRTNFYAPLGLSVQLPNVPGDRLFAPKVQVDCAGERASTTMPVLVRVDRICSGYTNANQCQGDQNLLLTREVYRDRAIDRALWYLFAQLTHRADDTLGHAEHTCWAAGIEPLYTTGHLLNAFLRRGHGHGQNRDADPYYRHVTQCGLHGILTNLTLGNIRFDDDAAQGTDSQGLFHSGRLYAGGSYTSSYTSSAWIEPVANFGAPDYVSPVGPAGVFGQTLRQVGQDLADSLVHCQGADGWWHYSCQAQSTDCSTNGWAPEALRMLERKLGVVTYDWAKTAQRNKLAQYSGASGCYYSSWKHELSGNGLVAWGWTEDETLDPNNANVMGLLTSVQNVTPASRGLYYIYAATKGLRSFTPEIRYLPNGRDWNAEYTIFLLGQQAVDGSFNWGGAWSWNTSIGIVARTAMTTQIIQSWLEAYAYPRAVPDLASPGTPITFDHSWSYVLDPVVSIVSYQWNVVDYLADIDLNGDGDCEDEGEHCNEDLDGNGVVEGEEIVWDYVTDDPNAPFVYAYEDEIGWGETVHHGVTLRVVDSAGRAVDNSDSVEIRISLINHAPIIVPHPLGQQGRYQGYVGTTVLLDGRASYDADADFDPFPGDEGRPAGIRDSITSLHFDLNFDGDFDDEGEDGMDGPVQLLLTDQIVIGDLVAVPMRVCDDGQWNGECYDSAEQDCSLCAYGSAAVRIIANVEPPIIDPGTPCDEDGICEPYVSVDVTPVPLDLSGSYDPEGVLGLTYWYELVEGQGHFEVSEGYVGNEESMGPDVTYVPEGDGPRTDQILVTVCDRGGLCSEQIIEVIVPNLPPVIDSYVVELEPRPPVTSGVSVLSLGDGWVRVTVDAVRAPDWDAYPVVAAHDAQDDFAIDVDMFSDGAADLHGTQAHVGQRLGPPVSYPGGQSITSQAVVTDVDGATDSAEFTTEVPRTTAVLSFWLDVNGDGVWELAGDGRNSVDYYVGGDADLTFVGRVDDSNGLSTGYADATAIRNGAPVVEELRSVREADWEVMLIATAWDPEGDTLTYHFDFGDGSPAVENRRGVLVHRFPEGVYGSYTVRVVVSDGLGGESERTLVVSFTEPAANQAPVIEGLRVAREAEWELLFVATAFDPDGDELTYRFDFGDGSPVEENRRGVLTHRFPEGVYRSYTVRLSVLDGRGGEVVSDTDVDFAEPPPNEAPVIHGVALHYGVRGLLTLAVDAWDPEGSRLEYRVHWGDEDQPESAAALLNGSGTHRYAFPQGGQPYPGWVEVQDEAGATAREVFNALIVDHPTEIQDLSASPLGQGSVLVQARAFDEDGVELLRYAFDFDADGVWEVEDRSSSSANHSYPEPGSYTVVLRVTDTWSGASVQQELALEIEAWEQENRAPELRRVELRPGVRGAVELLVEAWDADNDALDLVVHWGDEEDEASTERLVAGRATHTYAFPVDGLAYPGWVEAQDPAGATARGDFEALIEDHPTQIRELGLSVLFGGIVQARIVADDPDGVEVLRYSFDFDADGSFEVLEAADPTAVKDYDVPGTYALRVEVLDSWSGARVQQDTTLELLPWDDTALADDHLEGEEGQCLVFRVAPELAGLDAKVDPAACERDEPVEAGEWRWDFGDGTVKHGAEVGHRYADDGIYQVTVTGGTPEQPRRSTIQVLVVNVAPAFDTQPPNVAFRGQAWDYEIALQDAGLSDELLLELAGDAPAAMTLEPAEQARSWRLHWEVPSDFADEGLDLVLRASDGHTVAPAEGEEPVWRADGGHSEQRFHLTLMGEIVDPGEGEGEGEADLGVPEQDSGVEYGSLAGSTASDGLCGVAASSPAASLRFVLLSLLVLGGLALQRRR